MCTRQKISYSIGMLMLVVILFCLKTESWSAPVVLKLSHHMSIGYPFGKAVERFADEVKNRTGGNVEIRIFPAEQLMKATEQLDALRMRRIEMAVLPSPYFTGTISELQLWHVPLLFNDFAHVKRSLDGGLTNKFNETFEKLGFVSLAWGSWGFDNVFSNKGMPRLPANLKGQKLRAAGKVTANIAVALGSSPVTMTSGEIYMAAKSGIIDGIIFTWDSFVSRKLDEVIKYGISGLNVEHPAGAVAINKAVWDSFTPELRQIIRKTAAEVIEEDFLVKQCPIGQEASIKEATRKGVQVHWLTSEEKQAWAKIAMPVREKMIQDFPQLNSFIAICDKYR